MLCFPSQERQYTRLLAGNGTPRFASTTTRGGGGGRKNVVVPHHVGIRPPPSPVFFRSSRSSCTTCRTVTPPYKEAARQCSSRVKRLGKCHVCLSPNRLLSLRASVLSEPPVVPTVLYGMLVPKGNRFRLLLRGTPTRHPLLSSPPSPPPYQPAMPHRCHVSPFCLSCTPHTPAVL